MKADFPPCPVCEGTDWRATWTGQVRAGRFGSFTSTTQVQTCASCSLQRLAETACKDEAFYATGDYRKTLGQERSANAFYSEHDPLQMERLDLVQPHTLRGRTVADIGCAAGSFLDHVRGLIARGIAIEPAEHYQEALASHGYSMFRRVHEALPSWRGKVDRVFCFSVIEHVVNPRALLEEAAELLVPGGILLVSTPNRNDILMSLLPQDYPGFFYRSVHRWYFDRVSLARCAESARLEVADMRCVHRFGVANTLGWLRDRRPSGRTAMAALDDRMLDMAWRSTLEREFRGDYLYATLVRR